MFTLTVGYVSGIIAAIIFTLQYLLPNATILILVGVVGKEQNAATWSGVERELTSSAWPRLLQTDSNVSVGMKPKLRFVTWLRPICFFLIKVAAVVTPLGLYDTVAPSRRTQLHSFSYIGDIGPMGYGTPPRADLTFGRSCGDTLPLPCPGTPVNIQYSYNETSGIAAANITNDNYDMRIPEVWQSYIRAVFTTKSKQCPASLIFSPDSTRTLEKQELNMGRAMSLARTGRSPL